MKDAFGGIINIALISVFLLIVSGILGLTVNYTKAFRMKNTVISAIEQYEAHGCFNSGDSDCKDKIKDGASKFGYHPVSINCKNYTAQIDNLFCYKENRTSNGNKYYSIVTQVDINIPIINKMMGLSFFQVHGDTRVIKK